MKHVELGRTGQQVSQLALGCMIFGTTTEEPVANRILDAFTDAGGTFLDTANCYCWWHRPDSAGGESEELLGRWLQRRPGRREQVFLATKGSALVNNRDQIWAGRSEPDWEIARQNFTGAGAQTLRREIDDSLRRLNTDYVDLYYVHVDDRATPLEETLEALAGIVQAGKARYLGWSNVRTWRLERIRQLCAQHGWPAPVALQQQHSYLRRRPGLEHASIVDDEQLDYLREHDDLSLVAYSPILKGVFDDPAKRPGHWVLGPYEGPDSAARFAAVDQISAETGAPGGQVVLAWLLAQSNPPVIPLIGPRTFEQYASAVAAVDLTLSAEQLARLDGAAA